MFGHVKGAFTGATFKKKGRFNIADGGSIFLDEISELNLSMQAKFLRIIESGVYEPVGSDQAVTVNVRIISATNSFLENEIEKGQFRSDLYYRLCVIPILLPPLRERKDDIPRLAEFFLNQFVSKSGQNRLKLSKKAMLTLESYSWPGNVRELENILKYAVLKCKSKVITPDHFPYYIYHNKLKFIRRRIRKSKLTFIDVANAMQKTKGNKRLAAEVLGVSRSTLYRFFDRHKENQDSLDI
jgi:transcriptional regulator with PAS, ATPase and Fis domain